MVSNLVTDWADAMESRGSKRKILGDGARRRQRAPGDHESRSSGWGVIDPATYQEFDAWRRQHRSRTLADAIMELRSILHDEDYVFEIPPRSDRPNAFLDVLDERAD